MLTHKQLHIVHVLRLLPWCNWDLRSSGMFCSLIGSYLLTFRYNLLVPSSRVISTWPLKTGLVGCPETSAPNYQSTLHNIPEKWRSQFYSKKYQLIKQREENQWDATECFIALIICSTCFGHLYAHHQEFETIVVLLPHVVCNALVAGGQLLGAEQQAVRLGWGEL